ncbi:hypothetical protein JD276_13740 [Leucobacter sp. CSA1]|uniref:Uncharacterized protein n=1 Tax=Leucobacter chromiisoli TaxID=2796471 RepID=A0A934UVN2_9MICO|nr:hypothetical protein [Leucobacter chromiisoli]MBK0420095.1 hypothetical protein [Leucobacter chromiisoli]
MSERRAGRSRRVSRPAPEGVDETPSDHPLNAPAAEDAPGGWGDAGAAPRSRKAAGAREGAEGENDARLARDRPPHWG